jgi:hypothetical protein
VCKCPSKSDAYTDRPLARWLIDNGRDEEGMIVIADLHGGDMNGTVAKAEFNEIKDKVVAEVCCRTVISVVKVISVFLSVILGRTGRTK